MRSSGVRSSSSPPPILEAPDVSAPGALHLKGMTASAAMLLWYDIVADQVAEHDEWHTREHFPERVGIPGFLSAERWVAREGTSPRYFVRYDVRDIGVLTSPA